MVQLIHTGVQIVKCPEYIAGFAVYTFLTYTSRLVYCIHLEETK